MPYNIKRIKLGQKIEIKSGGTIDVESGGYLKIADTAVTASAAELNNACDVSARTQIMTTSGAVTAGVQSIELDHTSVTIAATIATLVAHQGVLHIKAITEPGFGGDHTVTVTTGTFNGTHKIATFADINDTLVVYVDSNGNGTVLENVGTVTLS